MQQQQQQRRPPARVRFVPPLASLSAAAAAGSLAWQQQQAATPPAAAAQQHGSGKSHAKLAVNFSGTWVKVSEAAAIAGALARIAQPTARLLHASHAVQDKAASDSMAAAMRLMGLGAVMRQAVKLIKGMTITQDDASFATAIFSVISW